MTASALAYLLWHGLRNRILSRIRRARNPRYLIGMVLGAVYMGWIFFRPLLMASAGPPSPELTGLVASIGQGIAVALILIQSLYWWVLGGNRMTLAFTQAEVAFLFPAPVSRTALIAYKLLRSQIGAWFSVLLGLVFLRRGAAALPIPLRAIGLWLFFTIPSLHSMGSALVRASWAEHGLAGLRRQRVAIGVVAAVFVVLALGISRNVHAFMLAFQADDTPQALGAALTKLLNTGALGAVLWVVRAVVAPMFAPNAAAWARAMPVPLVLLVAHAVWVFRSDAAFEEAAVAASAARVERIEAFKARRSGVSKPSAKRAKKSIRLAPVGHPAGAVLWKNILAFRRRSGFGTLIVVALMPLPIGLAIGISDNGSGAATSIPRIVAVLAVSVAVGLAFWGPMLMRNDLRQDMLNIVALKVLPLSGRTIVTAEVLSVVVPVALAQFALLGVAAVAAVVDPGIALSPGVAIGILAAGLPAVIVLEGSLVTVLNAAPVFFPAWTRLGIGNEPGWEGMGGRLMTSGIVLLMLAAMLVAPGGAAAGILYFGRHHLLVAGFGALLVGGPLLGAELFGALGLLGGALERAEPSEVA